MGAGGILCPLLLEDPGGGTIRDGLKAEVEFTATSGVCVCVVVVGVVLLSSLFVSTFILFSPPPLFSPVGISTLEKSQGWPSFPLSAAV